MLRIHLFGQLRVSVDETPWKFAAPPKTVPLWAYLLLHRTGQPLERQAIAFTLWPDDPESTARTNLRRHLHQLQRALPPAEAGQPWLISETTTVQWNPDSDHWLDVAEFERLGESQAALPEAVGVYTGDLLENVYDDWLFYERERLRDLYFSNLTSLIQQGRAARNFPAAISYAQQLLGRDPLREDTVRQLLALRYESGDRAGALNEFERFARHLKDELGVDPMPETVAWYEAIARNARLPGADERGRATADRRPPTAAPDVAAAPASLVGGGQPSAVGSPLPFVGREAELEQLRAWWSRAARGRGTLALVGGEAGIGKSRLTAELARLAETQGGRVLSGGTTFAEPAPHQALTAALRSALPLLAALEIDPVWLAAVARLIPELAARREAAGSPLPGLAPLDPERERARLFEALARCLEALAGPRPVLLLLEDLHWAGTATMSLLEFLAQRLPERALLIAATYREEEAPRAHPLREMRRRLQRDNLVAHLTLSRLPAAAVEQLVTQIAGEAPQASAWAGRLFSESEGNPFFLGELIHDQVEAGQVTVVDGRWQVAANGHEAAPAGVRATIGGRVARLSEQARALAELAAVIGPAFDVELVREVGGWSEAEVLDGLDELLDRHLVRETSGRGRADFTFTHHLIQAAVYADTPEASRKRRHRRVAQALLDLYPQRLDDLAAELAAHFDRGGNGPAAAGHYLNAAQGALRVYADDEAVAHLGRGIELAAGDRLRFDLLALREAIYHRRGERAPQLADLEQLEGLAQALGDDDLICEVMQRQIQYQRVLGNRATEAALIEALRARAEASGGARWLAEARQAEAAHKLLINQFEAAQQAAEQALAARRALNDVAGQVENYLTLGEIATRQGRFEEAQRALDRGAALAEARDDRALQAKLLFTAARLTQEKGDFAAAAALGQRMLEVYRAIGDRQGEADAHGRLAVAKSNLFLIDESRRHFAEAAALFQAVGQRHGQAIMLLNSGVFNIRLGRCEEGLELLRQAEDLFAQMNDLYGQDICATNESAAAYFLGDHAASKRAALRNLEYSKGLNSPVGLGYAYGNLGRAERDLGELTAAIEHLQASIEVRWTLDDPAGVSITQSDLVIAYVLAGESPRSDDVDAAEGPP